MTNYLYRVEIEIQADTEEEAFKQLLDLIGEHSRFLFAECIDEYEEEEEIGE